MNLKKSLKDILLTTALATSISACGGGGGGGSSGTPTPVTPVNHAPTITVTGSNTPLIYDSGNLIGTNISVQDQDNDSLTTLILANGISYPANTYTGLKRGFYSGDFVVSTTDGKDTTSVYTLNPTVVSSTLDSNYKFTGMYKDANQIPGVTNVMASDINSLLIALQSNNTLQNVYNEVNNFTGKAGKVNIIDTLYSTSTKEIIFQEQNNGQLIGVTNGTSVFQPLKVKDSDHCNIATTLDPLYNCN